MGFPGGSLVKNPPGNAWDTKDMGLISVLGRSPEEGYGNQHQYYCLENPMDRETWRATVHGSQTIGHDQTTVHSCTFLNIL